MLFVKKQGLGHIVGLSLVSALVILYTVIPHYSCYSQFNAG